MPRQTPKITYKSLFELTKDEIKKSVSYQKTDKYGDQFARSSLLPLGFGDSSTGQVNVGELIEGIRDLLSEALAPWIIEGLEVKATDPISGKVKISKGKGAVGGELFELEADTTMAVPFDGSTSLFYIVFYKDRLLFERAYFSNKLTLAKIVVPNPGVTSRVINKRDNTYDAFIQSFKTYNLYGLDGYFEEDTIELLRDNIGEVLAENLIGNIRLSENLKILNTAGTLELNSEEVLIRDLDANILSKFNRRGTFFYNIDGKEMARFTADDAKIGNILITPSSIQSGNFATGYLGAGFQITDAGNAEFNNILARGMIRASVFQYDTISAVGGNLLVLDADKLEVDM